MNDKPTRFFRSRWFWFFVCVCGFTFLLGALYFFIELTAKWELESLIEKARAKGEIADVSDLERFFNEDPKYQAADKKWDQILLKINERIRNGNGGLPVPIKVLTPAQVTATLNLYRPEMDIAKELLLKHPGSASLGFEEFVKHNRSSKEAYIFCMENLGNCYCWDADRLFAKGKTQEALQSLELCRLTSVELQSYPIFRRQYPAQILMQDSYFPRIIAWAEKGELSSRQLKDLQNKQRTHDHLRMTKWTLETNRAIDQQLSLNQLAEYHGVEKVPHHLFKYNDLLWRYKLFGHNISSTEPKWEQVKNVFVESQETYESSTGPLAPLLTPSITVHNEFEGVDLRKELNSYHEMKTRCFVTTLAILRFHRERNRLPKSLHEISPKYITKIPIDIYSNKPLRYQANGAQEFTVWSLWFNELDDGGTLLEDRDECLDLGFHVQIEKQKRNPPKSLNKKIKNQKN